MTALERGAPAAGSPLRVVQRNLMVYRRTWRGSVLLSFVQPLLFLSAMGLGLGGMFSAQDTAELGGVSYVHFLAPGLLAAACMQIAGFECTWAILGKISWRRNYEAMLATPLSVRDLVLGELGWMALRFTAVAGAFMIVITLFGIPSSPVAILALPAAVLTGLAFAAVLIAFSATQKNDSGFAAIFRFVLNPLFLFSGTFFPVARLPDTVEWLAVATPLYHGVEVVRALTLGGIDLPAMGGHLAYLVAFTAVGVYLADRALSRRMVK